MWAGHVPPVPATVPIQFSYVGYHRIYQDFAQLTQLSPYERSLIWALQNKPATVGLSTRSFYSLRLVSLLRTGAVTPKSNFVEFLLQDKSSTAEFNHVYKANVSTEVLPMKIIFREGGAEKKVEIKLPLGNVNY